MARFWQNPPGRRWAATVLLSVLAGVLGSQLHSSPPAAWAQTGAAGGDVFICAGQVSSDSYGLYLVDLKQRTIGVYQWLPNSRKLRFLAARNYTYDLKLDDYNTEAPPRAIKKLSEQAKPLDE